MESWYLLYCKRGQHLRAQEHLERQHVQCLVPTIKLEKMVRGRRTMADEPLFPNYMFIAFDPEKSIPRPLVRPAVLAILSVLEISLPRSTLRLLNN